MSKIKKVNLLVITLLISVGLFSQKQFELKSPNGRLKVNINIGDVIDYQVLSGNDILIERSPISLTLDDGTVWGQKPKLSGKTQVTVNEQISSQVYRKSRIKNHYNELTMKFKGNYNVIFRIYDDGLAYRFESVLKEPFVVKDELVTFNFPSNHKVYIPYVNSVAGFETIENQLINSFENLYTYCNLSEWDSRRLAFAPILIESTNGRKIVITEADLINYPGMYFQNKDGSNSMKGYFARYPDAVKQNKNNIREELVLSRKDYIAKCEGKTLFPWRVIVVSETDKELADNDMVYRLATPSIGDFSWVKPGKVSWDWWSNFNLYGVDFQAGVNNETYRYHIDFAAKNGLEYIIMDEGWSDLNDLYRVVPAIDLAELVAYGKSRNVGIILWLPFYGFKGDMENVCKHYSEMGIKGFKVDFMDRDDQPIVDFHYKAAEIAAKNHLLIDYHGTYKPTGLHRTFPNVLNYEGVFGLENYKWIDSSYDMVTYDVTIPFIRMLAGPADYTPGAMNNANKENYRPIYSNPMSQGTRCRQLAQYIVFDAPLNMLSDSPSNYKREKECTDFIAGIPTVWDETVVVEGEVAKYIAIARKKGDVWYLGTMTNWDEREILLDLTFLGGGNYKAEIFRDNVNSNRNASDYAREVLNVPSDKKIEISMKSGGGCAIRLYKN